MVFSRPETPADGFGESSVYRFGIVRAKPNFCRLSRVRRGDLPTVTPTGSDGRRVRVRNGHARRQSPPTGSGGQRFGAFRSSDSLPTVTGSPSQSADSPRRRSRRQVRQPSRRGDLPTVTGDRRNRSDGLPQPWRQSAATVPRPICRNRSPWQPCRRSRADSPRRQVRTLAAPDLPTVKGSPSRSVAAPSDSLPTGATVPTGSPWRSSDGDRRTRRRSRRENKVCL